MFYPSFIVVEQQCFMRNYFRTSGRGVYLQSFVRVEKREKYYFYFHIYNRARIFSLNESERKVSDISMASLKVETKQVSIVEILCSLNDLICEKYDGMYISASFK